MRLIHILESDPLSSKPTDLNVNLTQNHPYRNIQSNADHISGKQGPGKLTHKINYHKSTPHHPGTYAYP